MNTMPDSRYPGLPRKADIVARADGRFAFLCGAHYEVCTREQVLDHITRAAALLGYALTPIATTNHDQAAGAAPAQGETA